MIVVDTNIISALLREADREAVQPWLDRQSRGSVWATTITVAELRHGVALLPEGRRRGALEAFNERVIARFADEGRIAAFDLAATRHFALGMVTARAAGREVRSFADGAIGAIALSRRFVVATRDTGPFEAMGIETVNPWACARSDR